MHYPIWLSLVAAALAGTVLPAAAQTQNRVIVGYPPGGALNTVARLLADKLSDATGRAFVVENRAGAAGTIGAAALKGAPADGSTLFFGPDSNVSVYPHTVKKPVYTPLTDFVAIAHGGDYRIALAVHNSVPANDLRTFIAYTRAQPGATGYGTAGAGTNLHFYGVLIGQVTGANINHVPYRGTGPAIVDLVAGHLPATVLPIGSMMPHYKAGKIRFLGQTGDNRPSNVPDVPTFKELGYPSLAFSGWYGMFAPAGTPVDVINRYNDVIVKAFRTAELKERMQGYELEIREMSAAEFQTFVKADTERWGPIIRNSGFTASSE
ncbi:MAG: twin-arginine translocation pathway signal protein [Betaproteobacteria bacterium]|nr:twin-arginine translocation pathway signal protein [Betaproteobacteria bacterium]